MSQTHTSTGCLLSILRLLLLCVTDEKNILEKMESSKGLCIFMRIKYQTTIQASVPSDTEATAKVAKTQLKLRPRNYKHKPAGNIWLTPQSPVLHVSDSSNHTNLSYTCWYEHLWEILQLHLKLCNLHMVWLRVCDKKKKKWLLFPLSLLLILPKECSIDRHRNQLHNQSASRVWLLFSLGLENHTLLLCHSVI